MQNQCSYLGDLLGSVKLDGPLNGVPKARWQKKSMDSSQCNTSNSMLSKSLNGSQVSSPKRAISFSKSPNPNGSKTPKKQMTEKQDGYLTEMNAALNCVPNTRKTPSKTPSKTPKSSPSNKNAVTPGGDRFIPNRSGTDFDLSHFLIMQTQDDANTEDTSLHNQQEKQRVMADTLHGGDLQNCRILEYKRKPPPAPEGHVNSMRMVYTSSRTPRNVKGTSRQIPNCPEKILDAPEIMDDYYLNLLDWGKNNILAVALRNAVYLWNESTGSIQQLMELPSQEDYISSVAWIQEGNILAVGDTRGTVQLWDCYELKHVRSMRSHSGRVSSISWNSYICSSGSRIGAIHHADVRSPNFLVGEANAHTQEVCGLKWCADGNYLASGSNDNLLNIWASTPSDMHAQSTPLYSFSEHQAAVKALAWCPWQSGVLASGGGTADRHIRFWNCRLGTHLQSIDTKSQVCSIVWSPHYKELVSGHGYANHELIVWKYPTMDKIAELVGHTQRVLNLCLSPDATTVMSAGADETIRLWKLFPLDPASMKKAKTLHTVRSTSTNLHSGIR